MILVTGAAGKTGKAVIQALAARDAPLRALARWPEQADGLKALGAREVISGDLQDGDMVQEAVRGVRAIYHIPPNVHPDEVAIGETIIAAALDARVEHFVYHSVMHPAVEAMPHHWHKMRIEERLFESTLPFTILQPSAYMQNILANWGMISEKGIFMQPYKAESRLSLVDLEDVAQAAATVLTEPGHVGATYELTGTGPLSQIEVAAILSEGLGRPVRFERTPLDAWVERARSTGLGEYQIDALTKMFRYYDQYGFWGNPNILGRLLDRRPTSLVEFIRQVAKESA